MVEFSGYTLEDLNKCINEVKSFALEINPKFISTLRYKFSKPEYMKVANYTFSFWIEIACMQEKSSKMSFN